jgi:hypothetical protein
MLLGLVWPLLKSVLRGGIACEWGLPVASRGPADPWMLSLEPFSSVDARPTSSRLRLAGDGAYALTLTALFRCGSYTSWCFHIDSTVAAIFRARVSLARFGLIPAPSIRS